MASPAERQRRFRAHRKGDHSLCVPERCNGATVTPVTRNAGPQASALGARGRRLWTQLTAEGTPGPGQVILIEEACRIADRLDRLDALLRGDEDAWLKFRVNEDGSEVTVTIDRVLSEARQQAVALKQLVAELRQSHTAAKPAGRQTRQPVNAAAPEVSSGVSDLTARIRARRAQAEG